MRDKDFHQSVKDLDLLELIIELSEKDSKVEPSSSEQANKLAKSIQHQKHPKPIQPTYAPRKLRKGIQVMSAIWDALIDGIFWIAENILFTKYVFIGIIFSTATYLFTGDFLLSTVAALIGIILTGIICEYPSAILYFIASVLIGGPLGFGVGYHLGGYSLNTGLIGSLIGTMAFTCFHFMSDEPLGGIYVPLVFSAGAAFLCIVVGFDRFENHEDALILSCYAALVVGSFISTLFRAPGAPILQTGISLLFGGLLAVMPIFFAYFSGDKTPFQTDTVMENVRILFFGGTISSFIVTGWFIGNYP